MGEVYRARDDRLGREIAVKVLPEELAREPERIRRFEQEARAASALNHPSIVAIFDVGETDGVSWVAMELVEGETLEERLREGPLPIRSALHIAAAVADGLAAAHHVGVVHRDLKPSNVMLAREGFVKILDFGLAKLLHGSDESDSRLETRTSPGRLIGTAAYMSPEQAAGREADERADQFALGLLLYEMLSGRSAFREETAAETMTAILRAEPEPVAGLRPETPAPLVWIVERCLAKDPSERYAATADLARDLRHLQTHLSDLSAPERPDEGRRPNRSRPTVLPWLLVAALALVAVVGWLRSRGAEPVTPAEPKRLSFALPDGHEVATEYRPAVAVSPGGRQVVFTARDGEGGRRLYSRRIGDLEPRPLPGGEDGSGPFFSPDGEWLGFFAYGKLKKIPAEGGVSIALADASNSRGATWMADDSIVFSPTFSSGLERVRASGGPVETLSVPDPSAGEYSHRWPQALPDGRTLLFGVWLRAPHLYERLSLGLFDTVTGEISRLLSDAEFAIYSPTGHLLLTREGRLHTVGFDVGALELRGEPRAIADIVLVDHNTHAAHYAISSEGTLAYVPGSLTSERHLVWVDAEGDVMAIDAPPRAYLGVRLSPDGRRIAVGVEAETADVWIYDLVNGHLRRLTFEGSNAFAVWSPDGEHLTFSSDRAGGLNLIHVRADGTGEPEQLTSGDWIAIPGSWSPDGRFLAYSAYHEDELAGDIWILPYADGGEPYQLDVTPADERWAQFSPDGRWLAYVSNAAAGLDQVYVVPFPGPGPVRQVSTAGGRDPLWSADGRRIFFRNGDRLLAVDFDPDSEGEPLIGRARMLFEGRFRRPPGPLPNYHLGPDGRFLMIRGGDAPEALDHLNLVLDWWSGIVGD